MMPYQFSTTRLKRPESRSRRAMRRQPRSEEHTSELQSQSNLVCRLLLEKKKKHKINDRKLQRNQQEAAPATLHEQETQEQDNSMRVSHTLLGSSYPPLYQCVYRCSVRVC